MTEDAAKTKVCPIARMRASYEGNWDKGECIGSACMMWRIECGSLGTPLYATDGTLHGYCGLAGKP